VPTKFTPPCNVKLSLLLATPDTLNAVIAPEPSTLSIVIVTSFVEGEPPTSLPLTVNVSPIT